LFFLSILYHSYFSLCLSIECVLSFAGNISKSLGCNSSDELENGEKDRDGKVSFLTKIITCVSIALGEEVSAKPLKIVAGAGNDRERERGRERKRERELEVGIGNGMREREK
jgi:hypothetical protein